MRSIHAGIEDGNMPPGTIEARRPGFGTAYKRNALSQRDTDRLFLDNTRDNSRTLKRKESVHADLQRNVRDRLELPRHGMARSEEFLQHLQLRSGDGLALSVHRLNAQAPFRLRGDAQADDHRNRPVRLRPLNECGCNDLRLGDVRKRH
jgi:hypothetical protein